MDLLNSRELATAIWVALFGTYALFNQGVRQSLASLIKSAVRVKIFLPLVFLVAYVTAVTFVLEASGFWDRDLLKGTLLWLAFTGLVLPFSFVTGKYEGKILPRVLRDGLTIAVITEFLVSMYTFSLLTELIVIPIVTGVVVLKAFAERDEQDAAVAKLMSLLEIGFGLFILGFTAHKAVSDIQNLVTFASMRDFALPLVLSLALCPFVFVILVYSNFELLFVRISLAKSIDHSVKTYAKWQIAKHLKLNPHRARRFLKAHAADLFNLTSKEDVDRLLARTSI